MIHRPKSLVAILAVLVAALLPLKGWLATQAEDAGNQFQPPNEGQRLSAIGSARSLSSQMQRALNPSAFDPIPAPGPSDWLANHAESGQTFDQYLRERPNRPDRRRNKIYLQPLGDFDQTKSPDLKELQAFANAFFQLDVSVLPPVALTGLPIKSRMRANGLRQLLSTDVLKWCEGRLPEDAFCLLAITMQDLYPDESWNFVFGQASLGNRVGVYSFARYATGFYGDVDGDNQPSLMLLRSCKVLAHETGHMFGIKHCIFFHCLMNGSNHLQESDQQPVHVCPVCLRKLHAAIGFDVVRRYDQLKDFSKAASWQDELDWLENRIKQLTAPP